MVASNNHHHISDIWWSKNGAEIKSEPEFNNIRTDFNDLYLKGFLIGFRREIDRRIELGIKKEVKKKKINDVNLSEVEIRRVISDTVANEVDYRLDDIKQEMELVKNDRIQLKHDIDDLKTKHEEIKKMLEENNVAKSNEIQHNNGVYENEKVELDDKMVT